MSDKLPPTGDERCGARTGYRAHLRRGEVPCDSCRQSQSDHDRAYSEANREAIADRKRTHYDANREAIAEQGRAYYDANREAIAEQGRAYREANRDDISRRKTEYAARIGRAFAPAAVHGRTPWTAEDDAIIRVTYDQPMVMVAAQLRRTPWAVKDRRTKLRKLDRNQRKVTS